MRKAAIAAAITVAATFSALVLALYLWRIEPFLPERGGTTCFAAHYDPPRPIDLSSPRRDERSVGEVSSMRVEIHFPPTEKPYRSGSTGGGYDWRYSLRLDAGLTNSERLTSTATCEWRDIFINRIVPALSCYIDCDGGSVTVWRQIGRNALSVRFEAAERLRTGENCGGSGSRVFIGAEQSARSLPVSVAGQCESQTSEHSVQPSALISVSE
jgi:hypothetical protein